VSQAEVERGVTALTRWAAALAYADIPEAARRRMALIIGDDIAAILSAQDEPQVRAMHETLSAAGRAPEATLLRKGAPRLDAQSAAVGNALAASWNEVDEGYRKAPCHAGIYSLPALFAVAERKSLTIAETLRAGVGAYEIAARFARTWRSIIPPVHPHGIFNSVGAAAAAGLARGLDADQLLLAVSAASTMVSPGPFNHATRGALVRNAWAAAGAHNGMLAVDLALAGIGGFPSSPFDVYERCLHAHTDAAQLSAGLGEDWAVCDGYHKLHACCQYAHSSLDALEELLARHPQVKGGERVAAITVETHDLGLTLDNYQPATTLAAKFSLPHAIAAALVHGDAGVGAFSSRFLLDERVVRLRKAVQMKKHSTIGAWPLDRPGRVTLMLDSGEKLTADCPSARGGSDRPFGEDQVRAKIRALAGSSAPQLVASLPKLTEEPKLAFPSWLAGIFKEAA
jgi:2-methylcitrate dehydratase PrpD